MTINNKMESLHTAPRNSRQTKNKVSSSSLRYARQFLRSSHGAREDEGALIVFVEGYLRALWWMVFELLLERYLDRGRSWRRPKTSAWSGGRPNGLLTKIYCLYLSEAARRGAKYSKIIASARNRGAMIPHLAAGDR